MAAMLRRKSSRNWIVTYTKLVFSIKYLEIIHKILGPAHILHSVIYVGFNLKVSILFLWVKYMPDISL